MSEVEINKFFKIIHKELRKYLNFINDKKLFKEFSKVTFNTIFNRKGPHYLNIKKSKKEKFLNDDLFNPYIEIMNSYNLLKDIKFYCNNFPYESKENLRIRYLQYNIENYLNEIYILKNRLYSFLKKIERIYKSSNIIDNEMLEKLYSMIEIGFNDYSTIRGEHVHVKRFKDENIKRLSLLEYYFSDLIKEFNYEDLEAAFYDYYISEYNKIKKIWIKKINNDLKNINTILNFYFNKLRIMITQNNKLVYPF